MYTVARFTADPPLLDDLVSLGLSMSSVRPGVFTGLRKRGDGFACSVSSASVREEHLSEIQRFVAEFSEVIRQATRLGAEVTIDVAIEAEDRESCQYYFVIDWSPAVLLAIAGAGARLEVSVY